MMVLCILLAMLSLFLSLKLIYQRKLVQKVKKQIDFLIDRDTQTEIMVEKTDGTIQDLAASINHLLKKYRSMGQEIERSDTLFRDTITSLSHDLRTPLATANGYIQLLHIIAQDIQLTAKSGEDNAYDFSTQLVTSDDKQPVGTATGYVKMQSDNSNWKASALTIKITTN